MREIQLEVQARRKAEARANLTSYMTSFKLTNTGEVIPKRKQLKAHNIIRAVHVERNKDPVLAPF